MLLYTWANTFTSTGVKCEKWQSLWLISTVLCQLKWMKKMFAKIMNEFKFVEKKEKN